MMIAAKAPDERYRYRCEPNIEDAEKGTGGRSGGREREGRLARQLGWRARTGGYRKLVRLRYGHAGVRLTR